MRRIILILLFILFIVVVIVAGAGFFLSQKRNNDGSRGAREDASEEILYYTCGMHPSVKVSPQEYKKGKVNCPVCNMKLTPVFGKEEKQATGPKEKKILFYRNPMNPAITSKTPAKDEMGMDYIPVYEEDENQAEYYGCGMEGAEHVFALQGAAGMNCPVCGMPLKPLSKAQADKLKGVVSRVKIAPGQIERAGVVTRPLGRYRLYKEIRTVGEVAYDSNLAIAEEEFISALNALDKIEKGGIAEITGRAQKLVESAKKKLLLLGLSHEQIEQLQQSREIHNSLLLPGKKMWIYGEVYEYELPWVQVGSTVRISTASLPGEEFLGVISSLNPVIDPKTRSLTFRAEIDNPGLKLKPQMYVDVLISSSYISANGEESVLAIPKEAVLDTGLRKIVWVQKAPGEYEGREVEIGPEASSKAAGVPGKFYPVLKGLAEGELVVTKANFLIDSQSQISGTAASAYGGSLATETGTMPGSSTSIE